MKQVNSETVKQVHQKYCRIAKYYPNNSVRKNYFLAACLVFDKEADLDFIDEIADSGGLIGIGNSRLEKYMRQWKTIRIHAILHDAAGFIRDYSGQGPGYIYTLSSAINSCFLGHVTGLIFCCYLKIFKSSIYHLLQC